MSETMRSRPRVGPQVSIAEIADRLGISTDSDAVINGIALNTADVVNGDLYAALPGARSHGAMYAEAATSAGARSILTDPHGADIVRTSNISESVALLVVPDPRKQLADLSAYVYDYPSRAFATIGITGTQGKTTTSYIAASALATRRSAVIGTIGTTIAGVPSKSALTTPEAPQLQALFAVMREESVDACAMEVSSHALVKGRVDGFVFDVAVFLNLGRDHLDFHRDLEDYFAAKAKLFTPEHARRAVINVDDAHGRRLTELTELPVVTFSTDGRAADWQAVNIRPHRLGTQLEVLTPDDSVLELAVPLAGVFNVSNALAALAGLAECGYEPHELAAGIADCAGVPGRMERVEAGQPYTAVIDYAHKPDAVSAVLGALRPVTAGRLIVVLGAGGDRDHGKRALMGSAAAVAADVVFITDDNPRTENPASIRAAIREGTHGLNAEIVEVAGRRDAISQAVAIAREGDTVVVAGKGHEQGQEIAGEIHEFDDRAVLRELIRARQ